MTNEPRDPSRRAFGMHVATYALSTAIALSLGPNLAVAQSQMTQKAVSYQDTPKGSQQCDKCVLFLSPDRCKSVSGKISPKGWCMIYRPKTT